MSFKTELFIYVALFILFSIVLGVAGFIRLLQGDERRAVLALLGSFGCLLMPHLLARVLKSGNDNGDDTTEPGS